MRAAALFALSFALTGCDDPPRLIEPAGPAPSTPAAAPAPSSAPLRTMKTVPLFGGSSVQNLLIDPTFEDGDPGIGRWYVNAATGSLPLGQTVTAASPLGISLPVGVVTGFPDGATGSPKSISMIAQIPGGKGPYAISLWATTATPADIDLGRTIHVTLAQITGPKGLDIGVDPASTRVIGGRTWVRFAGIAQDSAGKDVPSFTLGALLKINMAASKTKFWLQSPEVVPKPLSDVAGMKIVNEWRDLTTEELLEIEAIKKIPLDVGIRSIGRKASPGI
jgi:hypothetical protein